MDLKLNLDLKLSIIHLETNMKKIAVFIAILGASMIAASPAYSEPSKNQTRGTYKSSTDGLNGKINKCTETALEKHPGVMTGVKVETEDGKSIIDVDIKGKDGKTWEVECDAVTGEVLEDKEGSDDKKDSDNK